ncbi:MAG: peptidase [Planctomycetaceae bacterium]|nr:MAG: peptidase [Planctomycetaceae bacterium]
MLFQQPGESPYDLRFSILGFQTRIAWTFWLIAIVLGYNWARGVDFDFGADSPGTFPLLAIWAACILASILIHELGHAIAFRRYGIEASVLLYHFGGLAIPIGSRGGWGMRLSPTQNLIIAAAGPAFQIGAAVLLVLAVWFAGYRVAALEAMPAPLAAWGERMDGAELETAASYALVNFFVLPSIFWGLLNLIPVLPMDGGRIAQSLISLGGGHPSQAHWLGVIAAAAVAIFAYQSGQTFLAIFFVWMGIDNYQATQGGHGWR